jgi:hypothetical protein
VKILLPPGYPEEEAFDLEDAPRYLNFERNIIAVDGRLVKSYDDLLKLASQPAYREREYIEIVVALIAAGG